MDALRDASDITATAYGGTEEEAFANARLIAAAPELYALAERIIRYFGDGWIDPILDCDIEIRNMARAALAKARGELASGDVSGPNDTRKIVPEEEEREAKDGH